MTAPEALRDRRLRVAVPLLLALGVWLVFGQTLQHGFVSYDDDDYVYDDPAVINGLSWSGLANAFTETDVRLWTPLTRLSHMAVAELFGLQPWAHHFVNVLLHTATAVLLFWTLRQMTGALWRSAFVAGVFALHPLHVESVAWVSERKDTLSGLFFVLTLFAYGAYVRQRPSRLRYLAVIALFGLGLLAKPMLVTLPFVLLLLDYWPLKRVADYSLRLRDWSQLIVEKLPLFALSGLSISIALFDPFGLNAPAAPELHAALSLRMSNAVVSYTMYIWQMFYPAGLAVRYPFPLSGVPVLQVLGSLALLGMVTFAAFFGRSRYPYLFVGWLWYVGMLVPVSQVVPLGTEARCDRYTYLPQIGLYILIAWAVVDLLRSWPYRRLVAGSSAAGVISAIALLAHAQTGYWKDSVTLWRRAVVATSPDWITYNNLGLALTASGHFDEAIRSYEQALRQKPDYAYAENNLATALVAKGDLPGASRRLERALRLKQDYAEARDNLGLVLAMQGRLDEAIDQFQLAVATKPDLAQAHNNLGMALAAKGNVTDAMQSYERALWLRPSYAAAHVNLGMLLVGQGKANDAITHYEAALKLEPSSPSTYNNLAWLLAASPEASIRNGSRAVELAEVAAQLTGRNDPAVLDTLAAAYAEAGQYDKAVSVADRAIALARSTGNNDLAAQLEQRRQLYLRREPYRDGG